MLLQLTLCVLVAQSTFSHIRQLDGALGTSIHEPVAANRVKLRRGYNLCKLLHVGGLDINDVKTLVLDVQVPKVDSQIITTDERLAIAVD